MPDHGLRVDPFLWIEYANKSRPCARDSVNAQGDDAGRMLPDHSSLIPVAASIQHRLKAELSRTCYTSRELLKGRIDLPRSLSVRTVNRWLLGTVKYAEKRHIDYMFERLADMPDAVLVEGRWQQSANGRSQVMTPDMRAFFAAELARTGASIATLFSGAEHIPKGVSPGKVSRWVSGRSEAADPSLWDFILSRFASLPDKPLPPPVSPPKPFGTDWNRPDHRPISNAEWDTLHENRRRTGLGGARLLKGAIDKPQGLTSGMVTAWLSGATRTALPAHLEYVLARYAAMPTRSK